MQIIAFAVLMVILFTTGIILITAGVIVAVVGRRMRKKGRVVKWPVVLSVIMICAGVAATVIPAGWIMMIRTANGTVADEYKDTGKMVVWEKGSSFTYDGSVYANLDDRLEDSTAYMMIVDCSGDNDDIAFNIRKKTGFWQILLNAYERDNVYHVESSTGIKMYYCSSGLYCSEKDLEKAVDYYSDTDNYEWLVAEDKYEKEKEYTVSLSSSEKKFFDGLDAADAKVALDLENLDEAVSLIKRSSDGLIEFETTLLRVGDKWYWDSDKSPAETSDDGFYSMAEELPEKTGDVITDALK